MHTLVFGMVALVLSAGLAGLVGVEIATHTVSRLTHDLVPAAQANAAVLQDLTNAETGLRGWEATDDATFLEPYYAARVQLPRDRAALEEHIADSSALRGEVAVQGKAADSWLSTYAEVQLLLPAGPDHVDVRRSEIGKQKFDRIRSANKRIADRLDGEIADSRDDAAREIPWILAALALVSLLGGVALLFGRSLAAQISRPLVDMHKVVDGWATGDGEARARVSGPREVRKVADALNNFADENTRIRGFEQEVVDRLTDLDRAKSDFLSAVSHELRTPLTSIAGYVELFEDQFHDQLTDEQSSMLAVVNRNVTRLHALIEDLLTLSQTESQSFRTSFDLLDLTHLTSDVAYDLQAMASARGVTINEVHPDRSMVMQGDASQLSRALLNLVSNAVKFSADGSEVTIRVRQSRDWAHLEVTDHGIGIPAGEMSNLATRFFRASNAVDAEIAGTGLGLRIVQAIVDNHGGRLEVESVEGEGTTARMLLPLACPPHGKKTAPGTVERGVEQTTTASEPPR